MDDNMPPIKIIIIEDSSIVTKIIRHILRAEPNIDASFAASFAEAKELYERLKDEVFLALVDLNLPDAPDGEVVDYMLEKKVPTVVLTGSFDEKKRDKLQSKGIVDYVTKEGRYSYKYAIKLVHRLYANQSIKVLAVDDSSVSRGFICQLLHRHKYQVLEACDGIEAIRILLDNPNIKLLITDYNMPKMDGFQLVQNIRYKYEKSDLIIIGLSSEEQRGLSTKFIKNGANDFLQKPFNHEEFHCRVTHNVESLELIEKIQDSANRDYLTNVYNRRYFFQEGEKLYEQAKAANTQLAAATIDIDLFKNVNDNYGHNTGDIVLKKVSTLLSESLSRFLVARAGGEEFFILLPGLDNEKALSLIDKIRSIACTIPIDTGSGDIYISFSGGVCNQLCETLDEQLSMADTYLYRAKDAGRNLIIGDD